MESFPRKRLSDVAESCKNRKLIPGRNTGYMARYRAAETLYPIVRPTPPLLAFRRKETV